MPASLTACSTCPLATWRWWCAGNGFIIHAQGVVSGHAFDSGGGTSWPCAHQGGQCSHPRREHQECWWRTWFGDIFVIGFDVPFAISGGVFGNTPSTRASTPMATKTTSASTSVPPDVSPVFRMVHWPFEFERRPRWNQCGSGCPAF